MCIHVSRLIEEFQFEMEGIGGKKITIELWQYNCYWPDLQRNAKISSQKFKEKEDIFIVTKSLPQVIYKGKE